MTSVFSLIALFAAGQNAATTAADHPRPTVIVVVGAAGTPAYGKEFAKWADRWQSAAKQAGSRVITIGRKKIDGVTDRDQIQHALTAAAQRSSELWLILIGHGTFDGREAKFNLHGLDMTVSELSDWLAPIDQPMAIINCASSSGPFVNKLSLAGRVIVTATKSGFEQNFARFGDYLSSSIANSAADFDKDGQTSLLEAWLMASRRTEEFYKTEGRISTEHALLDDNGDGQGTRPDAFRGICPVKKSIAGKSFDGYRAHQWYLVRSSTERQMPSEMRHQRDELELAVIRLREQKPKFAEDKYYAQLETVLIQLAELYERADGQRKLRNRAGPIRLVGFEDPPPPPMPTLIGDRSRKQ